MPNILHQILFILLVQYCLSSVFSQALLSENSVLVDHEWNTDDSAIVGDLQTPRRYTVNLDLPPEERWTHVVADNLVISRMIVDECKRLIPEFLHRPLFWLGEKLSHFFPDDYLREIKSIANQTGLALGELAGVNMIYDISDFKHRLFSGWRVQRTRFPTLACTSIVAQDVHGRIFHARNLDYNMGALLRNATIIVDFKRDGKLLFTATTLALNVGVMTAQKPHLVSMSLNARYSGGIFYNIFMEIYTRFRHPITFEMRRALEEETTFEGMIRRLSQTRLIAPEYLILGGTRPGEGVIISRNRWSAADVYRLNTDKGRWYLVETNDDHWAPAGDIRRDAAIKYMDVIGQEDLSPTQLFRVLSMPPLFNNDTIFSSVMSAGDPKLLYSYTMIRSP